MPILLYSFPFLSTGNAVKRCNDDGTWFQRDGVDWTDYTSCLDKQVRMAYRFIFITVVPQRQLYCFISEQLNHETVIAILCIKD